MCYLSGGLFHQNKFPVKFIGPNLFFPWLLVFYYLTDAFVLVLFTSSTSHPHPLYRSTRSLMFFKVVFASFTGKHLGWSLFLIKFFYRTPPVAASIHVTFHVFSFTSLLSHFHYFLTVVLLSSFEETLYVTT